MKYFILLFVFLYCLVPSIVAQPSIRVSVKSGQSVDFIFNSLNKYNTGIEYLNYTNIAVKYTDIVASNWQMDFRANTATILGSGTNNLPLSTLRLKAAYYISGTKVYESPGYIVLTDSPQNLVPSGDIANDFSTNVVKISYDCGVNQTMKGEKSDVYTVDIVLEFSAP